MDPKNTTAADRTPESRTPSSPPPYEPPRILAKRAVERVTLVTGVVEPGGGIGGE